MRHAAILLAFVLLASIAALGISALESPSAEAASEGNVRKCGGGEIFLKAREKKAFIRHNNIRRNHDLPTFCVHPDLQRAARAHSTDMLLEDYFDHNSFDSGSGYYEDFSRRIESFDYTDYSHAGENIAYGSGPYRTPVNIMDAWMNSPGHRANILNGDFREIGIGVREGNFQGTSDVVMYTADFGTRPPLAEAGLAERHEDP